MDILPKKLPSFLSLLLICLCIPCNSAAQKRMANKTFRPNHFIVYGGYGVPAGSVSNIGGLVKFPSAPANDIYKSGFTFGAMLGFRRFGWIAEFAFEVRELPLTNAGQELANLSRTDGKKVDTGYFSFNLFVGKSVKIGNNISPFIGISNGLVDNQLRADGEEPHDNEGYGMAARLGADWLPIKSKDLILRLELKYELISIGVSIPHDLSVHLGLGWGFVIDF